ncbi:hypothetical protein D9613_008968 [Agrocybe pediades]|uniref:Glycolipid transfer protein domain-containing protein n=1 Tax=Agrocybe pediades TaxID=84607 RepID=A0A8H4R4L5_9AGAR|nr:hypothetical protein D9613_008968 [Agrocybe pediades]
MAPYFETVKSFADVPFTDDGIETASFLEASDGLVQMFDLLGSGVFGFVQADIRGNIAGVRARHATPCLVRLVRGLAFTCKALQHMQKDTNSELHVCFKRSYDEVLKHHHNFVIRSVVTVAIRAVPRRDDFLSRIAQGSSVDKLNVELARWLEGLEKIVQHTSIFLERGGYGKV